ncbi:MAG: hypothetical protein C0401_09430 [Anaerolinea sp.]|nr:hypothetical protein [Anaerolinea sp.]
MKRKTKSLQTAISPESQIEQQLDRFKPMISPKEFIKLLAEVKKTLIPAIRINPLKTKPGFTKTLIDQYGWSLTTIPYCPTGYRVETIHKLSISSTVEHKTGMYYIQEAASMLPVELFNIGRETDALTLDLAASPGGKTTHLIDRQKDSGLVIANDSSQGRIQALKIVLQHWGACSAAVTRFPGEKFGGWYPNTFDRALIDAPCSMQGLRTAESHASRPVTDKESRTLSLRQIALLTSSLQAVRVGGEVVYSTCTLLPEEDEGVVDAFLCRYNKSVKLLEQRKILTSPAPGIQTVDGQGYKHSMKNTIRFWPHRYQTAGFFACIFQKTGEIDLPVLRPPEHSMENAGFYQFSSAQQKQFSILFESWSGYPLQHHLEINNRVLVRRNERVFVFPRLLLERFRSLPVQSAGILLGEDEPDGFVVSHEWVSRFGAECQTICITLDDEQFQFYTQGMDIPGYSDCLKTNSNIRVVMDSNERILGRGKVFRDRLKNLSFRQFA